MTQKKAKPKAHEDPEQSRRFIEAANAIEAGGGLSHTEAEQVVDRLLSAKERHPQKHHK